MIILDVNIKLLEKIKSNNNTCLCSVDQKCPCIEFLFDNICKCGVYKRVSKDTLVKDMIEANEYLEESLKNE